MPLRPTMSPKARIVTRRSLSAAAVAFVMATGAQADKTLAQTGVEAFAAHCFSPFLTARTAAKHFDTRGLRHDFYDLDPFSTAPPSPASGVAPARAGTDRRCEVAFDGNFPDFATTAALAALSAEGITTPAALPQGFAPTARTALLAARRLNPRKIAVVEIGVRDTTTGSETHLTVHRMTPQASEGL